MLARSLVCYLLLFTLSVRIIDRMICFRFIYVYTCVWACRTTLKQVPNYIRAHFDKLLVRTADFFSFVTLLSFDHFILYSFVANRILSMLFSLFLGHTANEHHVNDSKLPRTKLFHVICIVVCLFVCLILSLLLSLSRSERSACVLSIACHRFFCLTFISRFLYVYTLKFVSINDGKSLWSLAIFA